MKNNGEGFRVLVLVGVAFLSSLLCNAVGILLMTMGWPMPGMFSLLLTVPLAAFVIGFLARNVELGFRLGAFVGAASAYGFCLLLNGIGTQGSGHMVWLPDTCFFFIFVAVGWIHGFIGGFGADRSLAQEGVR